MIIRGRLRGECCVRRKDKKVKKKEMGIAGPQSKGVKGPSFVVSFENLTITEYEV